MTDKTKAVQTWADSAMYTAEKSDAVKGPQAFLLSATPDPLGAIAAAAEAYEGRFYTHLNQITDDMRRRYLGEMQRTILAMPLEAVNFQWHIKGVTRSFTHQMVRQRTAAYSQESMRFAVKEDLDTAVALPPSLQRYNEVLPLKGKEGQVYTLGDTLWNRWRGEDWQDFFSANRLDYPSDLVDRQYIQWRETVEFVASRYNTLINNGMPAEEARGLAPHNVVTQLNYHTNLRNYKDHAGLRLCTQAQFEWRSVWVAMLLVLQDHCSDGCEITIVEEDGKRDISKHGPTEDQTCDNWQFRAIAEIFLPVCYHKGGCQFMADFDRKCNIRPRVEANRAIGRPSTEWSEPYDIAGYGVDVGGYPESGVAEGKAGTPVFIGAIHPAEWLLNDAAAR